MKIDTKSLFLAAACFAAGFLLCLTLVRPAPGPRPSPPVLTTSPMMAFTQFQPRPFHIFWTQDARPNTHVTIRIQSESPSTLFHRRIVADPLGDPLSRIRSLDLIDTHYQPHLDLRESGK